MKKKILIPTDFSKNAWNAITYAADLFKNKECSFFLLNAYNATMHSRGHLMKDKAEMLSFETEKNKSASGLANILEMLDFRGLNEKHEYHIVSVKDDPLSAIQSTIEKKDIELVVMGTKGASNYENKLFGSNTINVMENLRSSPILGIPLDARLVHVKEVVFPTSFKTHYKRRELIHLVEIAKLQDANICVLHVNDHTELTVEQQENKQLLEECLEDASFSLHHIGGSDINSGVKRFVESRGSDMVSFINRKHSFLDSIFSTPMVKELGMFSKVPLLVMHDTSH